MKHYKITIGDDVYAVTVQTDAESTAPAAPPAAPAGPAQREQVDAPLPGTILSVDVTPGQPVRRGQVLLILEAMKMENEIVAPCDGVVSEILVSKGTSVASGTPLCVIS